MNVALHFLLNYAILTYLFGDVRAYLSLILLFSVLLDLDHLPYMAKFGRKIIKRKFGPESRSRFHELYGLTIVSVFLSVLSIFADIFVIKIVAFSIILHYAFDFIFGKTRPFYPFSKEEVFTGICPEKLRVPAEIILTGTFAVIFWLTMIS